MIKLYYYGSSTNKIMYCAYINLTTKHKIFTNVVIHKPMTYIKIWNILSDLILGSFLGNETE